MNALRFPFLALLFMTALNAAEPSVNDPYLWLEDVTGEKPLEWARAHNVIAQRELEAVPAFKAINERLRSIYDSSARIPAVGKRGDYYYNFWQDAAHVRGLYRRTTLEEYRKENPVWETVLDLDALAALEHENWIWHGPVWLEPSYERCLIKLSRGGSDANVVREFDPKTKSFVADGFVLPEAKSNVAWRSRDLVFVGTDFGPGSMTDSGYPRVVKEWKRGTPLAQAHLLFEGVKTDVSVSAWSSDQPGFHREFLQRGITFYTGEFSVRVGETFEKLDLPLDAEPGAFREFLTVKLRSAWTVKGTTYSSGALLAIDWDKFLAGERAFSILFNPGPRSALVDTSATRHSLILNELENVRSRIYALTPQRDGTWKQTSIPAPDYGTATATAVDDETDNYFLNLTDFLTPNSLYLGTLDDEKQEKLKQLPTYFLADGLEISQHEATSKDGTRIPYFQVSRHGLTLDGRNPTLLYGYGGFEISMTASYNAGSGAAWLERGGVYVLANIRGGGEFGPPWHEAALKENRQRAYDDFIAIAEDLSTRKVTSPKKLGIMGGSNGGLLMGVMYTQRPDLFGAVVCQVPLLDMQRYNQLLAGASWMGEYGNPDVPAEWAYIRRYSPYQNITTDKTYPPILFTTSTRDDRVHPGHARKMVARLDEQHANVLYYENIEGGHGGAANNQQRAYMNALAFAFLIRELMD